MKRLALIAVAVLYPACAWAQGVNDPSTPNHNVVIVNPPQQPAPPNATPNIPSAIQAPPPNIRRAQPYYGSRTRGSGSSGRR